MLDVLGVAEEEIIEDGAGEDGTCREHEERHEHHIGALVRLVSMTVIVMPVRVRVRRVGVALPPARLPMEGEEDEAPGVEARE